MSGLALTFAPLTVISLSWLSSLPAIISRLNLAAIWAASVTAFWSAGDSFCQVFSLMVSGIGLYTWLVSVTFGATS